MFSQVVPSSPENRAPWVPASRIKPDAKNAEYGYRRLVKKSNKKLAAFVARFLGRVLAILLEGISTFFRRLALPAKPCGLLAVCLLGFLADLFVAVLLGVAYSLQ